MLCFIAAALYTGPGVSSCSKLALPITPDYTGYQGLCMNAGGIAGIEAAISLGDGRSFRYGFDLPALERRDDIGMMLLSSPCNPTGRCISADEQATLVGVADRRDVPLVIDHAYGEPFPQICETLTPPAFHPNVINCFSFSKAGLPGERVGFAIGHEQYIDEMVSFLANSALHSSRLAQMAAAKALRSGRLDAVVSSVITGFYADRRMLAEKLLWESLPSSVNWRLHSARGGMFCWLWIDEDWFDDMELYRLLKLRHVFIAPGRSFFTGDHGSASSRSHSTRCFRISLTVDEDILVAGINHVADAVRELRDTAA
jgi:valine--pyruvate aminotransferase